MTHHTKELQKRKEQLRQEIEMSIKTFEENTGLRARVTMMADDVEFTNKRIVVTVLL